MLNYNLLKELCLADSVSGDEKEVRDIILREISPYISTFKIDNMGNIIAFKNGKKPSNKKLLLSAHIDEVGFIVTDILDNGNLKFTSIGGINKSAAFAKQVKVGKNKLFGVVDAQPVHTLKPDEKGKNPPIESLQIDIGAKNKEEAQKYVSLGDSIVFDSPYENKNGRIISKALDDRIGCLILIEMIKQPLPYDMCFGFFVQEEIGLRGAKTASYSIAPDSAIVVEATTAADLPFSDNEKRVCLVGGGAVVSFMDRSTIYDKEYYRFAMQAAQENGVKAQTKTMIAGGNDAGAIHCSRNGVRTIAVSVPCRYLHSSSSLIYTDDAEAVYTVVNATAEKILQND